LLKVSPLVARLISVPDDLSLEELHDVLQLVLGWSGQAFYNFRIHGQEIGRRRHLRIHLPREFQLWRRAKFLYAYDFLDLWEWEIRVLDIEPGSAEQWRPHCLAGRAATPQPALERAERSLSRSTDSRTDSSVGLVAALTRTPCALKSNRRLCSTDASRNAGKSAPCRTG
jgi:hypothetical protein